MVNLGKLKQVWEMRKAAKTMQSALSDIVVTGEALRGQVKLTLDGNQKIMKVTIDPALMQPEHQQKVEEGVIAAHQDAHKELQSIMKAKLQSGELKMPDFNM
jgi:DNA-binding YbaB/EbfC family protein